MDHSLSRASLLSCCLLAACVGGLSTDGDKPPAEPVEDQDDDANADEREGGDDSSNDDEGPGPDREPEPDAGRPDAPDDGNDDDPSDAMPVAPSAAGDLIITELHAAPAGYPDDAFGEWVELFNPSADTTYDLSGCVFSDKPSDSDYIIKPGLTIAPGAYVVLSSAAFTIEANGFISDEIYGDDGTGLSGGGDAPTIACNMTIIDTVDYGALGFPVPDNQEGSAIQLDPAHLSAIENDDGASWCFATSVYVTVGGQDNRGTPRAANVACPQPAQPAAAGDIVITEIHAAPLGYADDAEGEWVEIFNPSATITYDLSGCVFSDKPADADHVIAAGLTIAPGEYRVLSSAVFTVESHGFVSDEVYGPDGTGLSGGGDAPTIACGGTAIDTVDYGALGFPVPDDQEGAAIQLDPASLSGSANDDGANWCFAQAAYVTVGGSDNLGSPRAANAACP